MLLNPGIRIGEWARSGRRLNESTLAIGDTVETDKWRAHRYVSSIVVTDLTNAGKRGKKVQEFALYGMDARTPVGNEAAAIVWELAHKGASPAAMEKAMRDFKGLSAGFEARTLRGVDVMPGGFKPIRIQTDKLGIEAGYDGFLIRDSADAANLGTCIPKSKGGKKAIPAFYRWVQDNERAIRSMTFQEVLRKLRDLDIDYHYYCAMD